MYPRRDFFWARREPPSIGVPAPRLGGWLTQRLDPLGKPVRAAQVLWFRYCAPETLTRKELAARFGVTAPRIREIEYRALHKLCRLYRAHRLTAEELGEPGTRLREEVLSALGD